MDPNVPTYGVSQVMPLDEHETAVEHYEKLLNIKEDKIVALQKEVSKLQMKVQFYEQHHNKVGKI